MRDLHSPQGCPEGAYEVDYAAEIDGDAPQEIQDAFRDGYRQASKRGLYLLNQAIFFIERSRHPNIALWQVATALGLSIADERSDAEIAAICGANSRACISKGRLAFQRACEIKPMPRQKTAEARSAYRETRKKQVNGN